MRRPEFARISRRTFAAGPCMLALVATWVGAQTPSPTPPPPAPTEAKPTSKPAGKPVPPARKTKPADAMPLVMSSEALARARGKPPEGGRYDGEPDWSRIPPWKQASFFGIRAEGKLFIYVVDCSGSMIEEDRLDRAKAELRRSIDGLQQPQRFKVIFYNDRPIPMPGELPKSADYPSKAQLSKWLHLVQPDGPTDPRSSLALALALKPDAIFLLSDGAFPDGTVEAVGKSNSGKVPIHCVDLADGAAGDGLRQIAADSGGRYTARGR